MFKSAIREASPKYENTHVLAILIRVSTLKQVHFVVICSCEIINGIQLISRTYNDVKSERMVWERNLILFNQYKKLVTENENFVNNFATVNLIRPNVSTYC